MTTLTNVLPQPLNSTTSRYTSSRFNPLEMQTMKNLDVEKLEEDLAKEIQRKKCLEQRERKEIQKIFDESKEIKELKNRINMAKLNQERTQQIYERQTRKLNGMYEDAETDEQMLKRLDDEKKAENEKENRKKLDMLNSKFVLHQQMKDREKQKEESKVEYMRDRQLVDNIVNKIFMEDMNLINETKRKKEVAKSYMVAAYDEKERRKAQQKEDERQEKERVRKYFEEMQRRENEQKAKKAAIEDEKNKIFEKLSLEQEKRQAEKDYWERVRNELYVEEMNRKEKIKELQEQEKKQRQKEEMLDSAIQAMRIKENIKKEEDKLENDFKCRLMEKFAEDERLEVLNAQKRKTREIELKKEIERQWQEKRRQYQLQKEIEIRDLINLKEEERKKRELIEREKERLVYENEEILKSFFAKGYQKSLNSLKQPNQNIN